MRKKFLLAIAILLFLYSPLLFFSFDIGIVRVAGGAGILSIFNDKGLTAIFFSSIWFAAASSLIALCLGFGVAFIIAKTDLAYAKPFLFLYILPIAIPPFVTIEAVLFFSELTGKDLFSPFAMVVVSAIANMPFSAIIITAGFQSIPRNTEEAGRLSSPGYIWFGKVTLPYLRPYLFGAFILTFVFAFTSYEIPSLMNVQSYTLHVFNQFGAFYDFGKAAIMVQPVFLLLGSAVVLQSILLGRRSFFDLSPALAGVKYSLGKAGKVAAYAFLTAVSLIVLLPSALVFSKLIGGSSMQTGLLTTFLKEVGYSFTISILGAMVSIALAVPYVRIMVRSSELTQRLLSLCSLLPLAVPSSFIAVGLIRLTGKVPCDPAIAATAALVWGLGARFFPVISQILYAGSLSINPQLQEAAMISRRSSWGNLIGIWLPLHATLIGQAFLFFMLLSISEIGLAVLLVPPDCMTASVNIYSMLHYGFKKEVALETLMVLFVVMVLGAMVLGLRRKGAAYGEG